jgi:tRNA(Ile)-lysidine synthetase-like protein
VDLEKRFEKSLDELGVANGHFCLVALSGGGDSVALLELLSREKDRRGIKIHAARVVHGIRGAGEEDAENELCRRLCLENGVPFTVIDVSGGISGLESDLGCGPEQAARTARHNGLETLSGELGADAVLFGHTADDQLETVMMRLLSGAGPEGLKGIAGRRGRIVRPLLFASRQELRRFLEKEGISWAEDRTNDEFDYRRNRVRKELLPLISEIFPGWPSALSSLAERSREAAEALELAAETLLPSTAGPDSCSWDGARWHDAPDYLKAAAVWKAVDSLDESGVPDLRFPWRSVKALRDAVSNGKEWKSGGLEAQRCNGRIYLRREVTVPAGRILLRKEEAEAGFDAVLAGYRIRVSARKADHGDPKAVRVAGWPLEIRFGRTGCDFSANAQIITEKSSRHSFTDADEEIFYISIDKVIIDAESTEGNNA